MEIGGHAAPRAITLGSPHRGTRMAVLGAGVNAAQMRRGSAWLAEGQKATDEELSSMNFFVEGISAQIPS